MPHDLLKDCCQDFQFVEPCFFRKFAAVMEHWKTQPAGSPLPPGRNMAITRSCKFSFISNIFMGCGRDHDNGNYDTPTLELTFAPFAFTEAALLTGPAVQAICGAFFL